jgi:hypothetical protein
VTLEDPAGHVVGRRDIASNVATGCRGPDTVNLAVREPGKLVLRVRFSDGKVRTWPVTLAKGARAVIHAARNESAAATPETGPRSADRAGRRAKPD